MRTIVIVRQYSSEMIDTHHRVIEIEINAIETYCVDTPTHRDAIIRCGRHHGPSLRASPEERKDES